MMLEKLTNAIFVQKFMIKFMIPVCLVEKCCLLVPFSKTKMIYFDKFSFIF